jgi:uncharacterized membrane protein YdbT with pleckstrin-like domain
MCRRKSRAGTGSSDAEPTADVGIANGILHLPIGIRSRQSPHVNEEHQLWKSSPSQWLNLGHYLLGILLAAGITAGSLVFFQPGLIALVIPLFYILWRYLVVRCTTFELTTERLRISTGVLNRHIDEIELYRVKDIVLVRPWWMRLTGLTTLKLQTSDRTLPLFDIPAMSGGIELREQLRSQVEIQRDRKRVREMDFDDVGDGEFMG